nr:MAG TPA: hypothetical protein [Caudoviricetes sp.]
MVHIILISLVFIDVFCSFWFIVVRSNPLKKRV